MMMILHQNLKKPKSIEGNKSKKKANDG